MESAKEEFLRRFEGDYGYPNAPKGIDEIRATEFKRLEGLVYLDHAGAALYSEAQMEAVAKDLTSNVYANPHSQSDASVATNDMIETARLQVLNYFNASPMEYKCIFTSGATAALKLVGECFPWCTESCYMYTMENHNSVLGIREYALDRGATALAVDVEEFKSCNIQSGNRKCSIRLSKHSAQRRANGKFSDSLKCDISGSAYNLFAFPSECNFSGQKFCLDLVNIVKKDAGKLFGDSQLSRGRWLVLIDAAKGCATEPPDLAKFPADFVVFSFYKIFGYPTGLGALIVRSDMAEVLTRTYFSGGTVLASIADVDFVKRREITEHALEDGTVSFLAIASLRHGFKIISTLTMSAIARHTTSISTYVRNTMMSLKHENGLDVCVIYGHTSQVASLDLGPTISFNLKSADGSWIGYREVEKLACFSRIQLRTGCFCNPGACAKFLGLSHSDLITNFETGHVCWDDNDILNGKPTGAVRISFGYMSTFEDAENFLKFLRTFLVKSDLFNIGHESVMKSHILSGHQEKKIARDIRLKSITIYPVKSCAGFSVDSWLLSDTGLKYDREWLLQGFNGEALTQKKVPQMRYISTFIDFEDGLLHLESPYCKEKLHISIGENSSYHVEEMDVYGQRYEVQRYNDSVNMWFTEAIGQACAFVRCSRSEYRSCMGGGRGVCRDISSKLNFVNEAQVLLIAEESVSDLNRRLNSSYQTDNLGSGEPMLIDVARFRPNLVISGAEPYAEDDWRSLCIGEAKFTSVGGCSRCQMINFDQRSGLLQKSKEPLATLASYRRVKGKILFGVLLRYEVGSKGTDENSGEVRLHVGQEVYVSNEGNKASKME